MAIQTPPNLNYSNSLLSLKVGCWKAPCLLQFEIPLMFRDLETSTLRCSYPCFAQLPKIRFARTLKLRKKIKRGCCTAIWKSKWEHKSAPENSMEWAAVTGVSRIIRLPLSIARIRSQNKFPVTSSNFPVQVYGPISNSKQLRLTFFPCDISAQSNGRIETSLY